MCNILILCTHFQPTTPAANAAPAQPAAQPAAGAVPQQQQPQAADPQVNAQQNMIHQMMQQLQQQQQQNAVSWFGGNLNSFRIYYFVDSTTNVEYDAEYERLLAIGQYAVYDGEVLWLSRSK